MKACHAVTSGLVAIAVGVLMAAPARANTVTLGPQAMEGDLHVNAGDVVRAGISFTMPGSHPGATVQFANPTVEFPSVTCVSGSGGGSFVLRLDAAGTYTVPQNDNSWFPTGDQRSAAAYQGSAPVPDLCHGGTMSLRNGAALSADAQSSDTSDALNVRFHYSANGSSGSWSATTTVTPSSLSPTTVPLGGIGAVGLIVALGAILGALVRRRTGGNALPQTLSRYSI